MVFKLCQPNDFKIKIKDNTLCNFYNLEKFIKIFPLIGYEKTIIQNAITSFVNDRLKFKYYMMEKNSLVKFLQINTNHFISSKTISLKRYGTLNITYSVKI